VGAQLALERAELGVEVVDNAEQRGDRSLPDPRDAVLARSSIAPGLRNAVRLRRSPHCVSSPNVRLIAEVRSRIRCARRRSRSRLARSSSDGNVVGNEIEMSAYGPLHLRDVQVLAAAGAGGNHRIEHHLPKLPAQPCTCRGR
jgi:hypothetical protein